MEKKKLKINDPKNNFNLPINGLIQKEKKNLFNYKFGTLDL